MRDFINIGFFLIVSYFAYRNSKIKGHIRVISLMCLLYITVFDIVDIISPIQIIYLQILWIFAAIVVSITVLPYLFRIFKRDIKNLFMKYR